jgi:hypothetical protein
MKIVLLALLLLPFTSGAQELPDAPTPVVAGLQTRESNLTDLKVGHYNRRIFIAGVSLLGASKSADMWSTRIALDKGRAENNPFFGQHPSTGRLVGIQAANFIGESAAFYMTERSRHAWIRWSGRAFVGLVVVNHSMLAACNAKASLRSPACHGILPF